MGLQLLAYATAIATPDFLFFFFFFRHAYFNISVSESMTFIIRVESYNHHHSYHTALFHHHKGTSSCCLLLVTRLFHLLLTLDSHWYVLYLYNFVILRILYKWNCTVCNPLRLFFFPLSRMSAIHPSCYIYQNLFSKLFIPDTSSLIDMRCTNIFTSNNF